MLLLRILAGWLLAVGLAAAATLASEEIDRHLARAEAVKRTSQAEFEAELAAVEAAVAQLSPWQREYLDYLRAWQLTFRGDYEAAILGFKALVELGRDPLLRFRSQVTLLNAYTLARRFPESFEQLNLVAEELERVQDDAARAQALGAVAQLLNQVGEYTDSLGYSTRLMQLTTQGWARCGAAQLQYEARMKSGALRQADSALARWAQECAAMGEAVFAGLLQVYHARLLLANGQPAEAIAELELQRSQLESTRYPYLVADSAALLAQARLEMGELDAAASAAEQAIAAIPAGQITESLAQAWRVLARVEERRGNLVAALRALERHQQADRTWLDEEGRRALAFQMARHHARAKSVEIEHLARQNEILQLQRAIDAEALQGARLASLLLVTVLGFGIAWGLRARRTHRQLRRMAQIDALTQLATRSHFLAQAARRIEQARRSREPLAMVLLDLDHFKPINDRFGHPAGDEALRQASLAIRDAFGVEALAGRLGGEEFGVLLVDCDGVQAVQLAERCRAALRRVGYGEGDAGGRLSGSFGVASSEDCGYSLTRLLRDSDAAMYEAKRAGRDRVVQHFPEVGSTQPTPPERS